MFKKFRGLWISIIAAFTSLGFASTALADIPNPDGTYGGHGGNPAFQNTSSNHFLTILPGFFLLFAANLVVECLVAWVLVTIWKSLKTKPLQLVGSVAVANAISYPLFYFGLDAIGSNNFVAYLLGAMIGEVLVIGLEAVIIWLMNKKTLSLGRALLVSLIINSVTVVLGIVLIVGLGIFFSFSR